MSEFSCPICGNSNPKYFGYINNKPYCRFCISLKGENAKEHKCSNGNVVLKLNYPLSKEQNTISERVIFNYKRGYDTLINAVCGAGKTELVYGVIEYALKRKEAVAFAVPRRDVAIELIHRIKESFPNNTVVAVYGGNTNQLEADIVVLTTHQLFRYKHYFDLIILDEIDAFPYNRNHLLNEMFVQSIKGHSVLMSATPNDEILDFYKQGHREILQLNTRFHRYPLPVPYIVIKIGFIKIIYLISKLKEYQKQHKPVFVFAPTIEIAESIYVKVKNIVKRGNIVHSKKVDRSDIISDFRKQKYDYLITTAVLERGVTIKNLQVIIFQSDHSLYDQHSLIQIAGRAGRKIDAPKGEVIFISDKKTTEMEKAIATIKLKNKYL